MTDEVTTSAEVRTNPEKIYPNLESEMNECSDKNCRSANNKSTDDKLSYKIDTQKIKINQNRINNFLLEKKQFEDLLIHYKKLKNKWTSIDSGLKIFLITSGGILSVSSVVITSISTFGSSLVLYVGVGIGALSVVNNFITESISIGISSKKKKINREICEIIEHGIDNLYLFQLKALDDNKLTNKEIEQAKEIINLVKKDIQKVKSGFNKIEQVEKEIKSKIKKELEDELREKLKSLNLKV